MSADRWIEKKIWFTHTMNYYSASRETEIVSYAKTWMNPEDIRLNKIIQSQKDK